MFYLSANNCCNWLQLVEICKNCKQVLKQLQAWGWAFLSILIVIIFMSQRVLSQLFQSCFQKFMDCVLLWTLSCRMYSYEKCTSSWCWAHPFSLCTAPHIQHICLIHKSVDSCSCIVLGQINYIESILWVFVVHFVPLMLGWYLKLQGCLTPGSHYIKIIMHRYRKTNLRLMTPQTCHLL